MSGMEEFMESIKQNSQLLQPIGVHSAYSLSQIKKSLQESAEASARAEQLKIDRQNAPIIKELQEVITTIKNQNEILVKQMSLLQEENERQKEQVKQAEKAARKAQIFSWVTFAITTAISVVAIIISIVK